MLTDNILDLIGNTPLLRLKGECVYAKAEFLNPGGSIKARVALAMLEGAERDGKLDPDSIIVEPTSGNTGIGVAMVGRLKGYHGRIVMPDVSLVDQVVEVSDEAAIETTRQLGRDCGLLVGISSGANVWAARELAGSIDGNVVTVLPDRAERYFSTALL
ncbi:MAG: pyridoxal-phosphate dependent enzyme [Planctomycetota bacterium]|jgi:cysteine synthase